MNWFVLVAGTLSITAMLYIAWHQVSRLGRHGRYFRPLFFVTAPLIVLLGGALVVTVALEM